MSDLSILSLKSGIYKNAARMILSSVDNYGNHLAVLFGLLYSSLWSIILILMLDNFHITLFDYGLSYNLLWRQVNFIPSYNSPYGVGYLSSVYYTKLISYILIPVMWIYPAIYNLLIVQSLTFGISGIIVYLIASEILKNKRTALLIELMWLIYFPLAAANVFPFHYLTLFDPFYLLGFYFFMVERRLASVISFCLSAMTSLLAPIILLFTLPTFLLMIKSDFTAKARKISKEVDNPIKYRKRTHGWLVYSIPLTCFALLLLILNYIVGGTEIYVANSHLGTNSGLFTIFLDRIVAGRGSQFLYLLFLLLPLAFLPLRNKYFLFPMIPPAIYFLIGYFPPLRFYYPMQYGSLIAPQLFISLIISVFEFRRRAIKTYKQDYVKTNRRRKFTAELSRLLYSSKLSMVCFVILNVALASVYSPVGPLNVFLMHDTNNNPPADGGYNLFNQLQSSSYNTDLSKLIAQIPAKPNVTVLAQFNMPQISGRYYFTFPGEFNPSLPIDYAINDPHSGWFFVSTDDTGPDFHNFNMFQLSNMLLLNRSYGIYGQSQGALLFKHDYSGSIQYFVPIHERIALHNAGNNSWESNQLVICPGYYDIIIQNTNSTSANLYVGGTLLSNTVLQGTRTHIYFPQYIDSYLKINGSVKQPSVVLLQTAPAESASVYLKLSSPNIFHSFQSNFNQTSFVNIPSIKINPSSFSYLFLINITTYEDGRTTTENIGNDAAVFGLGSNLAIWDQIENTGFFEFGFKISSSVAYIRPFQIEPGNWVYVAATYQCGEVSIYLDGGLVFTQQVFNLATPINITSPTEGEIGYAGHPFIVSEKEFPNTTPLNASLSSFMIFNGALTAVQIQNPKLLFNNPGQYPGFLYGNWIDYNYSINNGLPT